jgi:thioredoxin reductase
MTKPWDECWYVEYESGDAISVKAEGSPYEVHYSDGGQYDRAHLIAAAPAMARLLCRLEWSSVQDETGCVVCGEFADGDVPEHTADCPLDAALTAAGIDAAERERVRGGA